MRNAYIALNSTVVSILKKLMWFGYFSGSSDFIIIIAQIKKVHQLTDPSLFEKVGKGKQK